MPPYSPKTICEQILLVTIPFTDPRVNGSQFIQHVMSLFDYSLN